jgi:hypothetical protein
VSAFHWAWEWATEGCDGDAEVADTTARLALHVGPHNLMRNEDVWTRCPQDAVLASAYPLALWLAGFVVVAPSLGAVTGRRHAI